MYTVNMEIAWIHFFMLMKLEELPDYKIEQENYLSK